MDETDKKIEIHSTEEKMYTKEEVIAAIEQAQMPAESFSYTYEDTFMMEDIENRKLYINYQIDKNINELITYHILRYNVMDKDIKVKDRTPIKIFINSEGGSVPDGLSCLSVMKISKTPIYTISFGYCYSMGFHLFLGGTRRFASPDSNFMNHSGSITIEDNTDRVIDGLNFLKKQAIKNDIFVLEKTKMTKSEVKKSKRADVYYTSEEAYKLGIATDIIGVTCDIDEIL